MQVPGPDEPHSLQGPSLSEHNYKESREKEDCVRAVINKLHYKARLSIYKQGHRADFLSSSLSVKNLAELLQELDQMYMKHFTYGNKHNQRQFSLTNIPITNSSNFFMHNRKAVQLHLQIFEDSRCLPIKPSPGCFALPPHHSLQDMLSRISPCCCMSPG